MRFDLETLTFVECDKNNNKLAISGSDKDLTWHELQQEVDELKNQLIDLKLPKGHPIVIYGHKEVKFIVAIVACMSLGLPYIPVDIIYPKDRLHKIIDIVGSGVILLLEQDYLSIDKSKFHTTYWTETDPIIYIIFTSGSTGIPKGVQISTTALLDFMNWLSRDFAISESHVFMNQAPFSFDLSVYELVGFLFFGGSVVLNNRNITDNHLDFFQRLKYYKCNYWVSTPSFIGKFLLSGEFQSGNLPNLKTFLFCGEVLTSTIAKKILACFPDSQVLNSYGPTEATVATTLVEITGEIINNYSNNLPVGHVGANSRINLLNIDNGLGEIQIVGDNVSVGYLNDNELTSSKFSMIGSKRSFDTGDYGYFQDGMLFFETRRDDLIKFHGFRIAIGEIDSAIEKNSIDTSITIPLKRGNQIVKLVSFIRSTDKINVRSLKKSLSKLLPYYMVPADIVQLKHFPYSANHKIDKNELVAIYKAL